MCHLWMRNSHSKVISLPVCSKRSHLHLSVQQTCQKFGFQLPSETFPPFGRQDTCKYVFVHSCMPTYMHIRVCKHKYKHKCTHAWYRVVLFHGQLALYFPVSGYSQEFFNKGYHAQVL